MYERNGTSMPREDAACCEDCVHNEPRLTPLLGAGAHLNNLGLFLRLLLKTAGQIFHESQERNWKRMAHGNK